MTRRPLAFAGIFVLVVILAFALRDAVAAAVIVPLAYLWWVLKLYYASIPQVVFWGLLTALVFYSAVSNLIPKVERRAPRKEKILPTRGHIETLADLIQKSERGGTYYKWLIANRLGKNAREILAQREGNPVSKTFSGFPKKHRDDVAGRGWNPPPEIDSYLETGLLGSFASFSRPRWFWQKPKATPLDVKAQQVVDYLEDEMNLSLRGAERRSNPQVRGEIASGERASPSQ
jgi:hypothetical protein